MEPGHGCPFGRGRSAGCDDVRRSYHRHRPTSSRSTCGRPDVWDDAVMTGEEDVPVALLPAVLAGQRRLGLRHLRHPALPPDAGGADAGRLGDPGRPAELGSLAAVPPRRDRRRARWSTVPPGGRCWSSPTSSRPRSWRSSRCCGGSTCSRSRPCSRSCWPTGRPRWSTPRPRCRSFRGWWARRPPARPRPRRWRRRAASSAGPALGGLLVSLLGAPLAVLVDAASYLYSALTLSRVEVAEPSRRTGVTARQLVLEIRDGIRWIYRGSGLTTAGPDHPRLVRRQRDRRGGPGSVRPAHPGPLALPARPGRSAGRGRRPGGSGGHDQGGAALGTGRTIIACHATTTVAVLVMTSAGTCSAPGSPSRCSAVDRVCTASPWA